jgi:hypothetical protein
VKPRTNDKWTLWVSAPLSSTGSSGGSKPVTSLSLDPSASSPPFNLAKTRDWCERAGKGGAQAHYQTGDFLPVAECVRHGESESNSDKDW